MTRCYQSHYATIICAQESVEIYQHGGADWPDCLARMANKHAAVSEMFRSKLTAVTNPLPKGAPPSALCHECSEMVEAIDEKLTPHHGTSSSGCPLNNDAPQIYLHPRADLQVPHGTQVSPEPQHKAPERKT